MFQLPDHRTNHSLVAHGRGRRADRWGGGWWLPERVVWYAYKLFSHCTQLQWARDEGVSRCLAARLGASDQLSLALSWGWVQTDVSSIDTYRQRILTVFRVYTLVVCRLQTAFAVHSEAEPNDGSVGPFVCMSLCLSTTADWAVAHLSAITFSLRRPLMVTHIT